MFIKYSLKKIQKAYVMFIYLTMSNCIAFVNILIQVVVSL